VSVGPRHSSAKPDERLPVRESTLRDILTDLKGSACHDCLIIWQDALTMSKKIKSRVTQKDGIPVFPAEAKGLA
jgi:hypothetical protein